MNFGYGSAGQQLNSYLNSMSYPTDYHKDLMLIRQMYSNSIPYNMLQSSNSSSSNLQVNPLNLAANYSSIYGAGSSGGSGMFSPTSILPTSGGYPTTSTPSLSAGMANYNNPYSSTLSSLMAATASAPSIAQNLSNNLPSFSNLKSGSPSPLNTSSSRSGSHASMDNWKYLNESQMFMNNFMGKSAMSSASPLSTSGGLATSNVNTPPGPNAIKNPLLSKELSMPSSGPVISGSNNLPSIPTSVITKTSAGKDLGITPIGSTNKDVHRTMNSGSNRSSPNNLANNSRLTSIISGPSSTVATTRVNSNPSNSTRSSDSPEPHIIVKNVNAVNQSIRKTPSPANATKSASVNPIKNFNMGIVYPKKTDSGTGATTKYDIQAANILKIAQNQLNTLSVTQTKAGQQTSGRPSPQPNSINVSQNRIAGKSATLTKISNQSDTTVSRVNPTTTAANMIRRQKDIKTRPLVSFASNLPNEVTITPTPKKPSITTTPTSTTNNNQSTSGLTISPVLSTKKPNATYSRLITAPSATVAPVAKATTPSIVSNKPPQLKVLPQQYLLKQNKQTANATTNQKSHPAQLTKTSTVASPVVGNRNNNNNNQLGTLVRQSSVPIITGNLSTSNLSTLRSRQLNNAQSADKAKVPPALVRQNTMPPLKTYPQNVPTTTSSANNQPRIPTTNTTNARTVVNSNNIRNVPVIATVPAVTKTIQSRNSTPSPIRKVGTNTVLMPSLSVMRKVNPATVTATRAIQLQGNNAGGQQQRNIVARTASPTQQGQQRKIIVNSTPIQTNNRQVVANKIAGNNSMVTTTPAGSPVVRRM